MQSPPLASLPPTPQGSSDQKAPINYNQPVAPIPIAPASPRTPNLKATPSGRARLPAATAARRVARKPPGWCEFDAVELVLIAIMLASGALFVSNIDEVQEQYAALPGFYQLDDKHYQIYGANVPHRKLIYSNPKWTDENNDWMPRWSLNPRRTAPDQTQMPFGWVAAAGNMLPVGGMIEDVLAWSPIANLYTDTYTGAVSKTYPIAYQQEQLFKQVYAKTKSGIERLLTTAVWTAAEEIVKMRSQGRTLRRGQIAMARQLVKDAPAQDVAEILKITTDPIIIEKDGVELTETELAAVIAVLRLFIKLRTSTTAALANPKTLTNEQAVEGGKISVLVIASSRNDWYHSDMTELLDLPFWAKDVKTLVTGGSCTEQGETAGDGFATSELALAAWIRFFLPDFNVEVMDSCTQLGRVVEPGYLDSFDLVAMYHSPDHALLINNQSNVFGVPTFAPVGPFKFNEMVKETTAFVYPSGFYNFNNNKSRLQHVLNDHGLTSIPSQAFTVPDGPINLFVDNLLDFLDNSGWGCMLLKASFSSYSENMLKLCGRPATADPTKSVTKVKAAEWVWRQFQLRHGGEVSVGNISTMLTEFAARVPSDVDLQWPNRRSKLGKYISHIKLTQPENAAGWPVEFTAFKYVASFKDHFQLRTYWYNGGNYHLLGDRADLISESNNFEEWSWLRSKGGTIDDAALPLDKIRALGTATLKAIRDSAPRDERLPAEFEHVPAARVDFGCCLDRSDPKFAIADGWFINEVEPLACQLLDLAKRQIMRKRGVTGFGAEPNFRYHPVMHNELRRAVSNWAPVTAMFALEMAELATAVRDQKNRDKHNKGN